LMVGADMDVGHGKFVVDASNRGVISDMVSVPLP
jgi:hypothetical protein